jgi:hypothetical protein
MKCHAEGCENDATTVRTEVGEQGSVSFRFERKVCAECSARIDSGERVRTDYTNQA